MQYDPKSRARHHSFNEETNEPASLIERESVEIERSVPSDEAEPIEPVNEEKPSAPFESED